MSGWMGDKDTVDPENETWWVGWRQIATDASIEGPAVISVTASNILKGNALSSGILHGARSLKKKTNFRACYQVS
jgi:hypothetical protein